MNVTLLINIFSFYLFTDQILFLASNFLLIPSPPQTCPASHAVVIQGVVDPWIAQVRDCVVLLGYFH